MWKPVLKISCSVLLFILLFRYLDFAGFIEQLKKVSPLGIVAALTCLVLQSLLVSLRWQGILQRYARKIAFYEVLKMTYLGLGTALLLPNIVAEPAVKSLLLKKFQVPLKEALATVLLDKVFVVVGLFVLSLFVLPLIIVIFPGAEALFFPYLAVLLLLLAAWLLYVFKESLRLDRLAAKFKDKYANLALVFERLLFDKALIGRCLLITFFSQLASISALYILALFMRLDIQYYQCLLLLPPALLVTAIPIAFNGWGVRELAIIYMLAFIHIPAEVALALSVQYGLIAVLLWAAGLLSWAGYRR